MCDILDPHKTPRRVYHDDQAPLAVVNRKGEPQRALPTLVSYAQSYAFKDNGRGLVWDSMTQEMVEPNADEQERAMGFPTGTTNIPGISESQHRFLLGQAMDLNYLIWLVSLVVAEQKRLASSLSDCMGFYEMRSAIEPFFSLSQEGKMVGGGQALASHPWDVWSYRSLFAKTGSEVVNHGSYASELAHLRMELEEHVEKMFMEEYTTQYMEEIYKLCQLEGLAGVMEVEEEELPSPGIQYQSKMENIAPKERKEAVTKDTWKPMVGLEDGAEKLEELTFLKRFVDCFAFGLHDLGVLKGQEVRITLTEGTSIY